MQLREAIQENLGELGGEHGKIYLSVGKTKECKGRRISNSAFSLFTKPSIDRFQKSNLSIFGYIPKPLSSVTMQLYTLLTALAALTMSVAPTFAIPELEDRAGDGCANVRNLRGSGCVEKGRYSCSADKRAVVSLSSAARYCLTPSFPSTLSKISFNHPTLPKVPQRLEL